MSNLSPKSFKFSKRVRRFIAGDLELGSLSSDLESVFIPRRGADTALDVVPYSASLAIDFDAAACQSITATGPLTLTTANRSDATQAKSVSVRISNTSGSPIAISIDSDINVIGDPPPLLGAGRIGWIAFISTGPNETDTDARYRAQN